MVVEWYGLVDVSSCRLLYCRGGVVVGSFLSEVSGGHSICTRLDCKLEMKYGWWSKVNV